MPHPPNVQEMIVAADRQARALAPLVEHLAQGLSWDAEDPTLDEGARQHRQVARLQAADRAVRDANACLHRLDAEIRRLAPTTPPARPTREALQQTARTLLGQTAGDRCRAFRDAIESSNALVYYAVVESDHYAGQALVDKDEVFEGMRRWMLRHAPERNVPTPDYLALGQAHRTLSSAVTALVQQTQAVAA